MTKDQSSGAGSGLVWTHDTLRQHLLSVMDERDRRYEQRFQAQQDAMDAALVAAKEALAKNDAVLEARLQLLNEFRAAMSDRDRDFIPRTEVEVRMRAVEKRVDSMEGKADGSWRTWAYVSGAVAVLIALGALAARAAKL